MPERLVSRSTVGSQARTPGVSIVSVPAQDEGLLDSLAAFKPIDGLVVCTLQPGPRLPNALLTSVLGQGSRPVHESDEEK